MCLAVFCHFRRRTALLGIISLVFSRFLAAHASRRIEATVGVSHTMMDIKPRLRIFSPPITLADHRILEWLKATRGSIHRFWFLVSGKSIFWSSHHIKASIVCATGLPLRLACFLHDMAFGGHFWSDTLYYRQACVARERPYKMTNPVTEILREVHPQLS